MEGNVKKEEGRGESKVQNKRLLKSLLGFPTACVLLSIGLGHVGR